MSNILQPPKIYMVGLGWTPIWTLPVELPVAGHQLHQGTTLATSSDMRQTCSSELLISSEAWRSLWVVPYRTPTVVPENRPSIPTIHFQGRCFLVSGGKNLNYRVTFRERKVLSTEKHATFKWKDVGFGMLIPNQAIPVFESTFSTISNACSRCSTLEHKP